MDLGIEGRVAIVGGASRGLGRAIAEELAREGASLLLYARTEGPLTEAASAIQAQTGRTVRYVAADASRGEDLERVVDTARQAFGRIDILVNNAGGPPLGTFDDFDDAAWQRAFDLGLMSAVRLTRLVTPDMQRGQWGRILNLLSFTVRAPAPNLLLSNSIRLGVLGLAKTLSWELAPHILVNNIAPGRILTDRTLQMNQRNATRTGKSLQDVEAQAVSEIALGRYGTPAEFAAMAVFLASERASYITGQTFLCDGGFVSGV
jgi:3-oxoacyl-[acyl-carrier protein] reductase